jgi:hypothetical protein
MRTARVRTLLAVAVVAALAGWLVLDALRRSGGDPLPVPWTAPAGLVVLAGIVLAAGREVRRWVQGRRSRPIDPLVAARTAVLAQAAGYVGALLVGWYVAQALVILPAVVGERRTRLFWALGTALASALLAVAGLVAQRWCRRPPDEDEAQGRSGRSG